MWRVKYTFNCQLFSFCITENCSLLSCSNELKALSSVLLVNTVRPAVSPFQDGSRSVSRVQSRVTNFEIVSVMLWDVLLRRCDTVGDIGFLAVAVFFMQEHKTALV